MITAPGGVLMRVFNRPQDCGQRPLPLKNEVNLPLKNPQFPSGLRWLGIYFFRRTLPGMRIQLPWEVPPELCCILFRCTAVSLPCWSWSSFFFPLTLPPCSWYYKWARTASPGLDGKVGQQVHVKWPLLARTGGRLFLYLDSQRDSRKHKHK